VLTHLKVENEVRLVIDRLDHVHKRVDGFVAGKVFGVHGDTPVAHL
jgi:hypothetical protein